jgi:integrase
MVITEFDAGDPEATLHALAGEILKYRRAVRLLAQAIGWASTGAPFGLFPPGPLWRPRRTSEDDVVPPANGELGLAFPNSKGGIDHRNIIVERGFHPAQVAAGVVNARGRAKYGGLHALRHFYASWCINRRVDGGLELPLKVVQARLGHASIQMIADRYGHLFPSADDGAELAAAERAFL